MINEVSVVETYLKKKKKVRVETESIANPASAARMFSKIIGLNSQECFTIICVDIKGIPTYMSIVHKGTINEIKVSPKDIMKVALLSNASAIIIGHNHPSGDLTPSSNDIHVTEELVKACKLMDIKLLDHIIINGSKQFKSLRESNICSFD